MSLITQNPYNVIGILAGENQRSIARQKAKINAFQKVGKSIEFDTDLLFAGTPDRSEEAMQKAFAGIEINQSKLFNALFWFVNHNHLDKMALNYLQSGDLEKTEEIWKKTTSGKDISTRNFSAFSNLGTLKIATAFLNGTIDLKKLAEGVHLKTELITSETFDDFCNLVADETYTVDNDKELENFTMALIGHADKSGKKEAKEIPSLLAEIHPKLKSVVAGKLMDGPINNIERKISQIKNRRNESPEKALHLARELYRDAKDDLNTLSGLLGKSDLKYKMIADKYSKELLQCGIDYFKVQEDHEELLHDDLGDSVMKIFKSAKSAAVGTQTIDRINENIEGLQEWIDNAEDRRVQRLIEEDLNYISSRLDRFQNLRDTVANVRSLIINCKPKLQNIKRKLGPSDDFYLKLSSAVANNAQGMLITVVNEEQEIFKFATNPTNGNMEEVSNIMLRRGDDSRTLLKTALTNINQNRTSALSNLRETVDEAISASRMLGELDMVYELRTKYNQNHAALKSINSQLNPPEPRPSQAPPSSPSSGGGGCYIATMAYGSYEHPQVLELRRFRDETLAKSGTGRSFIKLYYWLSPKLVKLLEGNETINSQIRKMLNQFIRNIK